MFTAMFKQNHIKLIVVLKCLSLYHFDDTSIFSDIKVDRVTVVVTCVEVFERSNSPITMVSLV